MRSKWKRMWIMAFASCVLVGSGTVASAFGSVQTEVGSRDGTGEAGANGGAGGPPNRPVFSLTPFVRYQGESDVGDARSSVFRYGGEAGSLVPLGDRLSVAGSLRVEESNYSWKDFSRVVPGVDKPLRDGTVLTLTHALSYDLNDRWSITGGAIVMFSTSDGASWGSSGTYGGFFSAKYKVTETLSLSAGVLGSSRLEDDPIFFPLLGVEWQIDDRWRLETTGLGIRGSCRLTGDLSLFADAGYEFREYRLKGDLGGGLGGGVLRDNGAVAILGVQWKPVSNLTVESGIGLYFGGDMRFDDSDGNRVVKVDSDLAPFAGCSVKWEF